MASADKEQRGEDGYEPLALHEQRESFRDDKLEIDLGPVSPTSKDDPINKGADALWKGK